jgi:AraC-like DNA-binding protein
MLSNANVLRMLLATIRTGTSSSMATRDACIIHDLASLGLPEVPTFGSYHFVRARGRLESHVHRGAFEVCFLIEGRQVYRVAGRDWLLNPGDAFCTRPDEAHDTADRPQEIAALRWLQVVPPARGRGFLALDPAASADLARRLARLPRVFRAPEGVPDRFQAAFAAIAAGDRLGTAVAISGLLLDACRSASQPRPGGDAAMQAVLRFIEDNLRRPLSAAELAHHAGLSLAWFKARFRAEIGQPPARYVMRRRIDRALELLAAGRPVTRVANDLGFASSQHFANVVRRWTGKPPGAWRG